MARPHTSAAPIPAKRAHITGQSARGMAMFAAAMLIVPLLDAGAKILGETLSPIFVAFLRYAIQTAILTVLLLALGRPIVRGLGRSWRPLALAGALMAIGISALFFALQHLPLANAVAIFFVEPLILTVFSAVFLRERVGRHRLGAVLVGLVGALVVLRPNVAQFGYPALLPIVTAIGFAGVMTVFRIITTDLDSLRIQTVSGGFAGLFLLALTLAGTAAGAPLLSATMPNANEWLIILGIGAVATVAQTLITASMKFAEASLIAPFQYLEIVGATALGYLLFNEFPDALTWTGTAIILAAGLYIIHRERGVARPRVAVRTPN